MRTARRTACCLLLLALTTGGWAQDEETKIKIRFRSGLEWAAAGITRVGRGRIQIERVDEPGRILVQVDEVAELAFPDPLAEVPIDRLYQDGKFRELSERLAPVLDPVLPFLDIPSNLATYVPTFLRSRYRMGDHPLTLETCDRILARVVEGPLHEEARLYKALTQYEMGDLAQVRVHMGKLKPVTRHSELAPPYWFLKAQLLMADDAWDEAQMVAARMVAFSGKDYEWLPAGLYLSMQIRARAGQWNLVRQINEELTTAYPESRWTEAAVAVADQMPDDDVTRGDTEEDPEVAEEPEPPAPGPIEVEAVAFARRIDGGDARGEGHYRWYKVEEERPAGPVYTGAADESGGYLQPATAEGAGASASGTVLGPSLSRVEYDLPLPASGAYQLDVRAAGSGPGTSTLFVELPGVGPTETQGLTSDHGNPMVLTLDAGHGGAFSWHQAGRWDLSEGTVTVRLLMRDPGVGVEALRLSPLPAAAGSNE